MTSILGGEWNLSPDGINIVTENGSIKEFKKVLNAALNTDLKEIGSAVLTKELSKEKTSKIVLQIQKIRNISAPKANEDSQAAPRMLKFSLTDGDSHVQAIEISPINSISRNHTPPGTKILVNNAKIISGYILLNSSNCTVLGGKVPHLIEKWEIAKSIQRNKRGNSHEDGPPPWVNFGVKIQSGDQDGNFKSLAGKGKDGSKENSEFELQRQGAIAEATAGAVRKVFGGRVKQNVQPTINQSKPTRERQERGKNRGRINTKEKDVDEKPIRPSEKVSLFAFLEDKLPLNDNQNTAKTANTAENQHYSRYQPSVNKNNDSLNRPHIQQNSSYQNYNPQQSNGTMQYSSTQNKFEKSNQQQNSYQNNMPRQNNKQQNNSYSKQSYQERQEANSNPKPYEKPKPKRNEGPSNSNPTQNSYSIQKEEINELTNNASKMSLNSQFASRSLRQHLNLNSKKPEESLKRTETQNNMFNIGDECLAKYWEDGKFYNAIITAITDRTYAVKFKGYGNIEEILKSDCVPVSSSNKQNYGPNQANRRYDQNSRQYSGSVEFRRSNRNYK